MVIVDSCGWLEWFTAGPLADQYEKYLVDPDAILMPAIILCEVYKVSKWEAGRLPSFLYFRAKILS